MIINYNNLYDICFPENIKLVGLSCYHSDLTLREHRELTSNFFWRSIVFGDVGDYECQTCVRDGVFILKPHFFLKRDGDQVPDSILKMVEDYGGEVITNVYDIIEYENSNLPRMDSKSRWH